MKTNLYKKRKPVYTAFEWSPEMTPAVNNCLAKYSNACIEEGWWGGVGGFFSVWDSKKSKYVDHRINDGDWVVIRDDGRVRVMDNDTFYSKYEEKK